MSASVALEGGRSGIRLARAGDQSGQLRAVDSDMVQELLLGGVGDEVVQSLGEELVGGGEVLLAVTEEHTSPIVEGGAGRFGHQRGLAQPGLPGDEDISSPRSARHPLRRRRRLPASRRSRPTTPTVGATASQPGRGMVAVSPPPEGLPENLDGLDGVEESFQGEIHRAAGTHVGCGGRP